MNVLRGNMVIFQKRIKRTDLQSNKNKLYLFGDNSLKIGMGGQAKEMRGEPNAVGIITKFYPSMKINAFLTDENEDSICLLWKKQFQPVIKHLIAGGDVIIPLDGLGTGLAMLHIKAPKLYIKLKLLIETLGNIYGKAVIT